MDQWRKQANEMFPELAPRIEAARSPYDLWVDLWLAFQDAYEQSPPDESIIARIYRYSEWCRDRYDPSLW